MPDKRITERIDRVDEFIQQHSPSDEGGHHRGFSVRQHANIAIVKFASEGYVGEEELPDAERLSDLAFKNVILDLSGVEVMSSFVVGRVVVLHRRQKQSGGTLIICNVSELQSTYLHAHHLDTYFHFESDVESAIDVMEARDAGRDLI